MKREQVNMAFYSGYEMARLFVRWAHKENVVLLVENARWLADFIENIKEQEAQKFFENKQEERYLKQMLSNVSPDIAVITCQDKNKAEEIREALFNLAPPEYREKYRIGFFVNGEELL